jgi:hypothetical protein
MDLLNLKKLFSLIDNCISFIPNFNGTSCLLDTRTKLYRTFYIYLVPIENLWRPFLHPVLIKHGPEAVEGYSPGFDRRSARSAGGRLFFATPLVFGVPKQHLTEFAKTLFIYVQPGIRESGDAVIPYKKQTLAKKPGFVFLR